MGLSELRADATLNRERLHRAALEGLTHEELATFVKGELADNLWPWLEAFSQAVDEEVVAELADQGDAIDELIDQSNNILHPEMTAKIVGVFESGKLLCLALEKLLADHPDVVDEMSKKRLTEMSKRYQQLVEMCTNELADITVDLEAEAEAEESEAKPDGETEDDGDADQSVIGQALADEETPDDIDEFAAGDE